MEKNIFITRKIPDIGINMLRSKGYKVEVNLSENIPNQKQIIKLLKKKPYDAVITLLTDRIDETVFDALPGIKMYANYATGYDNIDAAEAGKRDITVANAPGALSSTAVAEHTIALMLSLAKRLGEADAFVKAGRYRGWSPTHFMDMELGGKTLGLIGAGRIGGQVARFATGLGLRVIYYDVKRNEQFEKESGARYQGSLDEVLKQADFVSLHVPFLPATRHLINEENLGLMKPAAFLINTSRGGVVDERALERALKNKIIAGAGLDVFEFEPKISRGLRKLPNVVLTPHIASASREAREEMSEIAANNVIDFLEGRIPRNIVNEK